MDKVYNWGAIDGGIILKEILLSKSSVAIFSIGISDNCNWDKFITNSLYLKF